MLIIMIFNINICVYVLNFLILFIYLINNELFNINFFIIFFNIKKFLIIIKIQINKVIN